MEAKEREFEGFPKMARLHRDCLVTEKIDGTNAQIFIDELSAPITLKSGRVVPFLVGSRTRWIFPENDNFGFARWAYERADELLTLGPGRHYGEWWGQGIQRGYGLKEKRFSLFNALRWTTKGTPPACCSVVPILYYGEFDTAKIEATLTLLGATGSKAAPGFMKPEGIVAYHIAGNVGFKKTFGTDGNKSREELA